MTSLDKFHQVMSLVVMVCGLHGLWPSCSLSVAIVCLWPSQSNPVYTAPVGLIQFTVQVEKRPSNDQRCSIQDRHSLSACGPMPIVRVKSPADIMRHAQLLVCKMLSYTLGRYIQLINQQTNTFAQVYLRSSEVGMYRIFDLYSLRCRIVVRIVYSYSDE